MFARLKDSQFRHAVALLVGSMMGVGMFGIPFVFAKAGYGVGIAWLVVVAGAVALFDLACAELVLMTEGKHQIVGYASRWLGHGGRIVMLCATIVGIYGGLMAYIIVASEFLHTLLSPFFVIDPHWYGYLFAGAWSLFWLFRLRTVAVFESVFVLMYGALIAVIAAIGIPHITPVHFSGWTAAYWYMPYGVLLFAFAGTSAIPIQRRLLVGRERFLGSAILTAVVIVAVLYAVFATVVVGVSGPMTSTEALSGLFASLGTPITILGSLLGLLMISTSFIMLGTALSETFRLDYGVQPWGAWFLTLAPPLVLFMSGVRNFITILTVVGAGAFVVQSVLLMAAVVSARRRPERKPEFRLMLSGYEVWLLGAVVIAGSVVTFL